MKGFFSTVVNAKRRIVNVQMLRTGRFSNPSSWNNVGLWAALILDRVPLLLGIFIALARTILLIGGFPSAYREASIVPPIASLTRLPREPAKVAAPAVLEHEPSHLASLPCVASLL